MTYPTAKIIDKEIDYANKVVASLWGRMWSDVYKEILRKDKR